MCPQIEVTLTRSACGNADQGRQCIRIRISPLPDTAPATDDYCLWVPTCANASCASPKNTCQFVHRGRGAQFTVDEEQKARECRQRSPTLWQLASSRRASLPACVELPMRRCEGFGPGFPGASHDIIFRRSTSPFRYPSDDSPVPLSSNATVASAQWLSCRWSGRDPAAAAQPSLHRT